MGDFTLLLTKRKNMISDLQQSLAIFPNMAAKLKTYNGKLLYVMVFLYVR